MTLHQSHPPGREDELISVAIVDDHPIARRGIEEVLREAQGIQVVASAGSPRELALQVDGALPDVMVLDLYHDGDTPCLDAVASLSKATRVLVMSASARPADVLGAVRAGARGYVTKHSTPDMVVLAVETVAVGGFHLSSQLADILQSELTRPAGESGLSTQESRTHVLSPREQQALDLIARGFTHAQTATRMGVSKATVDTYVERIRSKLQVHNKAELTRAALEHLGRTAPR